MIICPLEDRKPEPLRNLLRSAVLRQDRALAVEGDEEMPAFAGRKSRAVLGEIALSLPAVHTRNISVVYFQINKTVVLRRTVKRVLSIRVDIGVQ
jgi:hypothetical protein